MPSYQAVLNEREPEKGKSVSDEAEKPETATAAEETAEDSSTDESGPETEPETRGCDGDEYIIPGPPLPDGSRMCLRHAGDHSMRPGVMRVLKDGEPMSENALLLKHREGTPVYDIVGSVAEMKKGPSKVNSPAFKSGWDRIFGNKTPVGSA